MGTSASGAATARTRTIIAALAALILALGLAPMAALGSESVAGGFTPPEYEGDARSASADSDLSSAAEGPTPASTLAGTTTSIVSADVTLDAADPVVGSFTVDGLTYAVGPDGVTLVAVDAVVSDGAIAVPASVTFNNIAYDVTAVGAYAFYLSGATSVELPASVLSVDSRAFRSSDVGRVDVAPDNPSIASFDGALYSADLTRLLLIPEGRTGSVPIPSEAEVVEVSVFSHCSLVDAISVDGDGAAFLSWDGLLYDASGTTLLRVPAGATEITIRDGCAAIAAGAMEGCAKLERINAPVSVTSISPDIFTSVPTVSLPAQSALQDEASSGVASGLPDQAKESTDFAPQLTAMVALSSADDDLPEVDPASIELALPEGPDAGSWRAAGFAVGAPASIQSADGPSTTSDAMLWQADSMQSAGSYMTYAFSMPIRYTTNDLSYNSTLIAANTYIFSSQRIWFDGDGVLRLSTYGGKEPVGFITGENGRRFAWISVNGATYWPSFSADADIYNGAGAGEVSGLLSGEEGIVQRWRPNGGHWESSDDTSSPGTIYAMSSLAAPVVLAGPQGRVPSREGYEFLGWSTDEQGTNPQKSVTVTAASSDTTFYAAWRSYAIDFDVDSEPGDEDYPGEAKDPISVPDAVGADGTIAIEDPKRPGYVFEGWVIPTEDGTEAVDQDLVYKDEADGKWYVDASKLPDYAGDDGRVELTARWTSVISVDVPSSVTFYADLVTQGQESREGVAEGAFGQSKVANQSQVDLRVVGLESSAVKTEGSTLGADSILKKADAATPSSSTQKLLSLYPSTKQWTADELQDPDAVGGSKAATAVDFDLDDILLEKSFSADDFTIAAGDTLNMGYRLNLSETGQQLDYDKLSTLEEGQSASIANVSYSFGLADPQVPDPTGSTSDPLYVELTPDFLIDNGLIGYARPGIYGFSDIKTAANDLSTHDDDPTQSAYYSLYRALLDKQVMTSGNPGVGPYFQLKVDGVYLPLQLIGICQDTKSDGSGKAGLTFQTRDVYAYNNVRSNEAGGGAFNYTYMNSSNTNSGGWGSAAMRSTLRSAFWGYLPAEVQVAIIPVAKYQQLPNGTTAAYLQKTTNETVWLPSVHEVFGASFAGYNESEALKSNGHVPFQYMAYVGNAGSTTNTCAIKTYNGGVCFWWFRSAYRSTATLFCGVNSPGERTNYEATRPYGVAPAFCL